jgi:hypothetical protein
LGDLGFLLLFSVFKPPLGGLGVFFKPPLGGLGAFFKPLCAFSVDLCVIYIRNLHRGHRGFTEIHRG